VAEIVHETLCALGGEDVPAVVEVDLDQSTLGYADNQGCLGLEIVEASLVSNGVSEGKTQSRAKEICKGGRQKEVRGVGKDLLHPRETEVEPKIDVSVGSVPYRKVHVRRDDVSGMDVNRGSNVMVSSFLDKGTKRPKGETIV